MGTDLIFCLFGVTFQDKMKLVRNQLNKSKIKEQF